MHGKIIVTMCIYCNNSIIWCIFKYKFPGYIEDPYIHIAISFTYNCMSNVSFYTTYFLDNLCFSCTYWAQTLAREMLARQKTKMQRKDIISSIKFCNEITSNGNEYYF